MCQVEFLVGQTVHELRYWPGNLRLVFDPEPSLYADVGTFDYITTSGDKCHVVAEQPSTVGPAMEIAGKTVERVDTAEGVLTLSFADRSALRCAPQERVEAWQVVGGSPIGSSSVCRGAS